MISKEDMINMIINNSDFEINADNISDGYHTFAELYEFRKIYNAIIFNEWYKNRKDIELFKSKIHADGEFCFGGGWFIVEAILPNGKQISNHYELKDWDLFHIPEVEIPHVKFDGHTPQDVIDRLINFIKEDTYEI